MSVGSGSSSIEPYTEYARVRFQCPLCGVSLREDRLDDGACVNCGETLVE